MKTGEHDFFIFIRQNNKKNIKIWFNKLCYYVLMSSLFSCLPVFLLNNCMFNFV